MKRLIKWAMALGFGLCGMCSAASAQMSLMSEATNKMFENANDWIIKPNRKFNTLKNDYFILLGEYGGTGTTLSTSLSPNSAAELGYYHAGKVPFSISAAGGFDAPSDGRSNWSGLLRTNIGLAQVNKKNFSNVSFGLLLEGDGSKLYTTTKRNFAFAVPFAAQFGPVYNYFFPHFEFKSEKTTGNDVTTGNKDSDNFIFLLYDKLIFKSMIPGGVESNVWASYSNSPLEYDREVPAFGTMADRKTNLQIGLSNRYDFPSFTGIQFVVNPKFYFDARFPDPDIIDLGYTLASDLGVFAQIGQGPVSLYMAMTPRLRFYHSIQKVEDAPNENSFELSTDLLWSGRFGINVLLANNASFDITCNINSTNQLINLSAQFTLALPETAKKGRKR